ncbi:MAG: DUF5606 domain-containing protein [Flavobacteriaceae bacterium]|nr:DUF5606 domain-containing protein [Flavobacteriaceae bacterium]
MTLDKLIVVAGKPGIFKITSQGKSRLIVESLENNKKMPIHNIHAVSTLNDIVIYTDDEEVPLRTVFTTIYKKESGKSTISHKEKKDVLIDFFTVILPNYDTERVYPNNIKKIIQWYNILVNVKFDFSSLDKLNKLNSEEEE